MKKIQKIALLTSVFFGLTNIHAEDLTDNQTLGLCLVAAGNIAEGTIKGLNDQDSIKKAKVITRAIVLAKKAQGKDPNQVFLESHRGSAIR